MEVRVKFGMHQYPDSLFGDFKKIHAGWGCLIRSVSTRDLFQAIAQDIVNHQHDILAYLKEPQEFSPENLFSDFPHLSKELKVTSIPSGVPDSLKSYVKEPELDFRVRFGLFSASDSRLWAVMSRACNATSFSPVVGYQLSDGKFVALGRQPCFEIDEDSYLHFEMEGQDRLFPWNHPCYPWIMHQPHYAYALCKLEDLLEKREENPLTGVLTTHDGAVRTCGHQIKATIQKVVDALTLRKKFDK